MITHTCFGEVNDTKLLLKKLSVVGTILDVCCSKKSIGFTSTVSCKCWSKNNCKDNNSNVFLIFL